MIPITVHRVEVRAKKGLSDAPGHAAARATNSPNASIMYSSIYLIEGAIDITTAEKIAAELLTDPVTQQYSLGSSLPHADTLIEVHPQPGVMDPDAQPIEQAIHAMTGQKVRVRTGHRYDLRGLNPKIAANLANPVIHEITTQPYHPKTFPAGSQYSLPQEIPTVNILNLDEAQLERLSRDTHLFLSVEEMLAIKNEYQRQGREPREIELETLAQTWSEHCVHKTLKATIRYQESTSGSPSPLFQQMKKKSRPGHENNPDGSVTIHNLLKSTIAAATEELIAEGINWCLSVFVDNAGVIAFDEKHAVCFKVETHNHPSAIEPYGGAATGIGGCIRDVIGTGLAAKPIAATDIFCVAPPEYGENEHQPLPAGILPPRRILTEIVAGVRDYGNRMGIPTLNGTVWFHNDYVGNPLVYVGCVGVMPRDMVHGDPQSGDRIIALGGRTGRDGIHGATFSSAELTDTHADEFGHAVQIGNAVTEKKMLDAILAARDHESGCLYTAITDCGAGGFSSAVGEMGEHLGAQVELDKAPLKYAGLSPTEIWISEAQERMVLAVRPEKVEEIQKICDLHDVELCDLGVFGTPDKSLVLNYQGVEVGRLDMQFMHHGLPETTREATWPSGTSGTGVSPVQAAETPSRGTPSIKEALLALLAHPNICSKHWIIRQYDHEVQGGSVVKPLVGRNGIGPGDAAVIQPVPNSSRGLGIANGLATGFAADPYVMTLNAIDECVRNLVCVGVDPERIAILDNFCWPDPRNPEILGGLTRAAEACYDGAKAYRTPFISGKDSLNNQFTTEDGKTIQIPPTLLISGFGIVPDIKQCVTMDAAPGHTLLMIGKPPTENNLAGSHYASIYGGEDRELPVIDLQKGPKTARAIHQAILQGWIQAAHDLSDGGFLVAAAEMAMAGNAGLELTASLCISEYFSEEPGRYLLGVLPDNVDEVMTHFAESDIPCSVLGTFNQTDRLTLNQNDLVVSLNDLTTAWRGTLDW